MTECIGTLKQIYEEVGKFPFDVMGGSGQIITIVAIAPNQLTAIGWYKDSGSGSVFAADFQGWVLHKPKRMIYEIMIFEDVNYMTDMHWFASVEDAKKFCVDTDVKFVRVLREVEVDE